MGFFQGLGRVLAGKPVFGPDDVSRTEQQPAAQAGGKVIPVVRIRRVECPTEGANMDVYIDIRNESSVRVYVDKIHLLGTARELDANLRPGEVKQFHVYRGPRPQDGNPTEAEVQYRTDSDDYFAARHEVQYHQEPDGMYRVWEFRLITPIKDMH